MRQLLFFFSFSSSSRQHADYLTVVASPARILRSSSQISFFMRSNNLCCRCNFSRSTRGGCARDASESCSDRYLAYECLKRRAFSCNCLRSNSRLNEDDELLPLDVVLTARRRLISSLSWALVLLLYDFAARFEGIMLFSLLVGRSSLLLAACAFLCREICVMRGDDDELDVLVCRLDDRLWPPESGAGDVLREVIFDGCKASSRLP